MRASSNRIAGPLVASFNVTMCRHGRGVWYCRDGMARVAPLVLVLAGAVHGCTCGRTQPAATDAVVDAAAPPRDAAEAAARPTVSTDAMFSAPIAALRVGGATFVAGLVAAAGVVRIVKLGPDGTAEWTSDPIRGVSWSPDVQLRLMPAGDGVAVAWRGLRDGSLGRTLVPLGAHGEPRGEPAEIGASYCATARGVAWIEPRAGAAAQVRASGWSEWAVAEVASVPRERDPSLVCGDRAVFVLGDGDDDLTASAFVPGEGPAPAPAPVVREADFADEEREHHAYASGDELGLVRIGASGTVALRGVPATGTPGPWRTLRRTLSEDDDVVAVDADANVLAIVYTHETDEDCAGMGAAMVGTRVLRVDRSTGTESRLELSKPECDRSLGPFWLAVAPGMPVVAWVERAASLSAKAPPIAGVALRALSGDAGTLARIELAADAVADAGCDESGCFLAALVRPTGQGPEADDAGATARATGNDGMQPEAIRVVPYP
jgi:hypothetical protein